jgi:hypothetical protein
LSISHNRSHKQGTGTHSLGLALEKLGFGPCCNLHALARNPGHLELWNNALDARPVDWSSLFGSYTSTVEWPAVTFIDRIIQRFPHARIILTLRDPESRYESAAAAIFESLELSAHNPDPRKRASSRMTRRLILEHPFAGRYWDKKYAIEVYREHIQRVLG